MKVLEPNFSQTRPKFKSVLILLVIALLVLVLCPFIGPTHLGFDVLWAASGGVESDIFWRIRLPRVCLAFMVGAALSVCGMTFQAMFRNVLATPYTLGVAGGAAFGAAVAMKLKLPISLTGGSVVSLFALGGALLSVFLVLALASPRRGFSPLAMLLAGVVMSYFFSSLVLLLQYLGGFSEVFQITRWLMGSLDVVGYEALKTVVGAAGAGLLIVFLLGRGLDLLMIGDEVAISRGVNTAKLRLALFFATSLVVAVVVAVCGPIGFVGLIVPYTVREVFRNLSHRYLLPLGFVSGGIFLTFCDTFSRLVMAPYEIPVGVITALLGGPFFLWILCRKGLKPAFLR